jgi:hypothetical protein
MAYRSNDDIYRALNVVRQFNSHQQTVDEAPYGLGARAADTVKRVNPFSKGGRIMAKNRKQSGNLANQVNDEWRALLGKKGYAKQAMGTVQDLRDFVQSKAPGTDADAFLDNAGIPTATADAPVPVKLQDKFLLSIGQAMNAAGAGGTTGTTGTADTTGTTDTGGGGRSGGTRGVADKMAAATGTTGTRRAPGTEPVAPGTEPVAPGTEPVAPGTEPVGAETPGAETPGAETPGAETPGAETPGAVSYKPGDLIQYTNAKGEVNQGNIISGPEQEGTENEFYAIKGVGGRQNNIKTSQMQPIGDKATAKPGLTKQGEIDILPPPEGDSEADASQPQFAKQVRMHNEVIEKVKTWNQASRDKLKAQLGASV